MKEPGNLLGYPQSTIVDKVVPKTMFYKFMEVNQRMKVRFVNDVAQICWLYKLSASTINDIAASEKNHWHSSHGQNFGKTHISFL